jgi:hypothetical protein
MAFEGATAEALDRRQNIVGRLRPAQWRRVGVALVNERFDGRD